MAGNIRLTGKPNKSSALEISAQLQNYTNTQDSNNDNNINNILIKIAQHQKKAASSDYVFQSFLFHGFSARTVNILYFYA